MFNKVVLVGNLTRDIELRYSQGGMAIAKSAIATTRKFTAGNEKKEEVCFIDITFFARSAEVANQYLRKGSKILVEGRLSFEQWVDQSGQKRSKHSVIVETMQMLDSKNDGSNFGGSSEGYTQMPQEYQEPDYGSQIPAKKPSPQQNVASAQYAKMPSNQSIPEIDIDDDEIPF